MTQKLIDSQNTSIRKHLETGRSITPLDALYLFGCFRLSARIWDLRRDGLKIHSEKVAISSPSVYHGIKYVTRYSLKYGNRT